MDTLQALYQTGCFLMRIFENFPFPNTETTHRYETMQEGSVCLSTMLPLESFTLNEAIT